MGRILILTQKLDFDLKMGKVFCSQKFPFVSFLLEFYQLKRNLWDKLWHERNASNYHSCEPFAGAFLVKYLSEHSSEMRPDDNFWELWNKTLSNYINKNFTKAALCTNKFKFQFQNIFNIFYLRIPIKSFIQKLPAKHSQLPLNRHHRKSKSFLFCTRNEKSFLKFNEDLLTKYVLITLTSFFVYF